MNVSKLSHLKFDESAPVPKGDFVPGVGYIPAGHVSLVITRDDLEKMKYWKKTMHEPARVVGKIDIPVNWDKALYRKQWGDVIYDQRDPEDDVNDEPYTDRNPDQEYMNKAFDGCPNCGSYEGNWQECPECGHDHSNFNKDPWAEYEDAPKPVKPEGYVGCGHPECTPEDCPECGGGGIKLEPDPNDGWPTRKAQIKRINEILEVDDDDDTEGWIGPNSVSHD